jgi:tetratricopeptide (TPR) repeat protein
MGLGQHAVDVPYLLDQTSGPVFCGRSLPGGLTVRWRSAQRAKVSIYAELTDIDCLRLQGRVNPIMRAASLPVRVAGLRQLMQDPTLQAARAIVRHKLQAMVVDQGSQAEIERLIAQEAATPGQTKAQQADLLNTVGYALLTQHPPRLLDFAEQLMTLAVAHNPSPYQEDSKGWAVYRQGRLDEALGWFERAQAHFLQTCTDDDQHAYLETLGHKGQAWLKLGRRDEALALWRQIAQAAPDESWADSLDDWHAQREAILASAKAQPTDDASSPMHCAAQRDQQSMQATTP